VSISSTLDEIVGPGAGDERVELAEDPPDEPADLP
jgi:hypothetical protein